jgi:hypothetical protein
MRESRWDVAVLVAYFLKLEKVSRISCWVAGTRPCIARSTRGASHQSLFLTQFDMCRRNFGQTPASNPERRKNLRCGATEFVQSCLQNCPRGWHAYLVPRTRPFTLSYHQNLKLRLQRRRSLLLHTLQQIATMSRRNCGAASGTGTRMARSMILAMLVIASLVTQSGVHATSVSSSTSTKDLQRRSLLSEAGSETSGSLSITRESVEGQEDAEIASPENQRRELISFWSLLFLSKFS